jgi:signal transduction histidine kinase
VSDASPAVPARRTLSSLLGGLSIYARSVVLMIAMLLVVNCIVYAIVVRGSTNTNFEMHPPPPPGGGGDFPPRDDPPQPPGARGGPGPIDCPPGSRTLTPGGGYSCRPPFENQSRWVEVIFLEFVVALPLALLFAHSLAAPLQRLAAVARQAGQGSGFASLPLEGPSEIRSTLECFNLLQSRLNKLIEERTHMVAAIAHDLRTPLTRLAFRLDDLPAPLGEKVNADIGEMKSMISAALDFIRERSVRAPVERLDFRSLVERVVDEQSDLGHDVQMEPGVPLTLSGVSSDLRRMVTNLVENGLKYGQRVRVRLTNSGQHCSLFIEDDGPGIPDNLQAQVFEPFYRIEASRNRKTGGIGLGLTAVRAIVIEHDGEVRLSNRKEGGLRVTVQLPVQGAS